MRGLLFLIFLTLGGCSGQPGKNSTSRLSRGEAYLDNTVNEFEQEYQSLSSAPDKANILIRYHDRLQVHLFKHRLDSIKVRVDTVIVDEKGITTRLHRNRIQFQYQLMFGKDTSPRLDSVYSFMKGLKTGNDTTVNFDFTGELKVNRPDNTDLPVFRIFAFPIPLSFNGK